MKFSELNPEFVDGSDGRKGLYIAFDCPCGMLDSIGSKDRLVVPLKNPLDGGAPHPHGWEVKDANFETFTLEPSVKRLDLCFQHFNVTNGSIVVHADSGKRPKK